MTMGYRLLGGTPDQRGALAGAAPDLFDTGDSAAHAVLIVSLVDAAFGDWQRLISPADRARLDGAPKSERSLYLIFADADRLDGAAAALAQLSSDASDAAMGVSGCAGGASATNAALARTLDWAIAQIAVCPAGPARAAATAFAAGLAQCCEPLLALERGIGGTSVVRGAFAVVFGSAESPFSRLLEQRPPVAAPCFFHGAVRVLRDARPLRPWWRSPPLAWIAGAALPLTIGLALAVQPLAALSRHRAMKQAAPVTVRPVPLRQAEHASVDLPAAPTEAAPSAAPARESVPLPGGDLATVYGKAVLPACEAAVQGKYPFIGNAAAEVSPDVFRRTFGSGGLFDSFLRSRLDPHVDRSGPVWRWRSGDRATAAFRPETPADLAETLALAQLADQGATFRVGLIAATGGVDQVEVVSGGRRSRLAANGAEVRLDWRLDDVAGETVLNLVARGRIVGRFASRGPWSMMRLIDDADITAAADGPASVTFGDGIRSATLSITVDRGGAVFGRNGLWTFRCPPEL